jgi:hypothetical protein
LELDRRGARALHAALSEALGARLLADDYREAAYELLERLDGRVPGWLEAGPVGGEAGYLLAAEAVLRALVDAEQRGQGALAQSELVHALGAAKPLGASATDVLARMRRERLLRRWRQRGNERWWTAAPAGRQLLARDSAARDDAWTVEDQNALLDLIYAEHRPGGRAHRPSVQAIGRLDDKELEPLVAELLAHGQLHPAGTGGTWLELSVQGVERARAHWRQSAPDGRPGWEGPPAPPLPYRRGLPIRIEREDRLHPDRWGDGTTGRYCKPAAWLARSSKTKLWATLRRDGAATWRCRHCEQWWLVYLQACTADGRPAHRDPAAATHNRRRWRPTRRP